MLNWDFLKISKKVKINNIQRGISKVFLLSPVLYVIVSNYLGLNSQIRVWAIQSGWKDPWATSLPISIEYFVFAVLYSGVILTMHRNKGLRNMPISTIFLFIVGSIFVVDNIYPYGYFSLFQFFVPATVFVSAKVLNLMGYQTVMKNESLGTPVLKAENFAGTAEFGIAWPCSGIDSLIIYSVIILLFLKNMGIPIKKRIIIFGIGGLVTYFINSLRIATIFVLAINNGETAAIRFHDYYGHLYSMAWILSYLALIVMIKRFLK